MYQAGQSRDGGASRAEIVRRVKRMGDCVPEVQMLEWY
jgi:hypothetical protein